MKSGRLAVTVAEVALSVSACGTGVTRSRTADGVLASPPTTAATSSPDILEILSGPFADKTCAANQAELAAGGTVLSASNATVAGVLPVLKAMGPKAASIAGLPPKTRLAICLYQRVGTTLPTADTPAAQAKHCPSDLLPVVLAPDGPLVAYTIAESGQRMTMPSSGPSILAPCVRLKS